MFKVKAKILKENPNIEEEFLIEISGIKLVAFISYQPQIIKIGEDYEIEDIELIFDEDPIETYKLIKEVDFKKKEVKIFHDSFRHKITGLLREDGRLDAGIIFEFD